MIVIVGPQDDDTAEKIGQGLRQGISKFGGL